MEHHIQGVEIMKTGKWNGDAFARRDLDEIVRNFIETRGAKLPSLKLGHEHMHVLRLQNYRLKQAGWVENLYRIGDTLLADFAGIPPQIYSSIFDDFAKGVSCEILFRTTINQKLYSRVLHAVALMGPGERPAVYTLKAPGASTIIEDEFKRLQLEGLSVGDAYKRVFKR